MILPSDEVNNKVMIEEKQHISYTNRNSKVILIAVIIFLSGILFSIVMKNPFIKNSPPIQRPQAEKLAIAPSIFSSPIEEYMVSYLILKRKTSAGDEIVYMDEGVLNKKLVRWGNYIYYGSKDYADKTQIFSHDISTGKTTTIYNGPQDGTFYRVSDIKVINDTLFFSIAGGGEAHTYWLDLPHKMEPQEVLGSKGYMIEQIRNDYYLIDGTGDGCGSNTIYSLLNIETKTATLKTETHDGCGGSLESVGSLIGIDKKNNMILSEQLFTESQSIVYLNIISMPVSNPSAKRVILSKNNMPTDIKSIKYNREQDTLLLTGKAFYIYNLQTYTLEKIADNTTDWFTQSVGRWIDNVLCISGYDQNGTETILLDLTSKKLTPDSPECVAFSNESLLKKQDTEAYQLLLDELRLPVNYELVIEKKVSNL